MAGRPTPKTASGVRAAFVRAAFVNARVGALATAGRGVVAAVFAVVLVGVFFGVGLA